jgi:hypothetical protein
VPIEVAKAKNVTFDDAKAEVVSMGKTLEGTLPWYELSYWEKFFNIDLIKPCIRKCISNQLSTWRRKNIRKT